MLTRRPATVEDTEFLWRVQWEALGSYVSQQFGTVETAQREHFDQHFQVTEHDIVEHQGNDVGYLSYWRRDDYLYLANIALLPAYQSRGIGTRLIEEVVDLASSAGLPVRLQVLKSNPRARALYERLGFTVIGENESHVLMGNALSRTSSAHPHR